MLLSGCAVKSLLVRVMVNGTLMTSADTSRPLAALQEFRGWVAFWMRCRWARVSRGCPEPPQGTGQCHCGKGTAADTATEGLRPHLSSRLRGFSPFSLLGTGEHRLQSAAARSLPTPSTRTPPL